MKTEKQKLIELAIEELEKERKSTEVALRSTRQAAIEAPGAMRSHSDTTKSQMANLAAKISLAVEEKSRAIAGLKAFVQMLPATKKNTVQVGTLVTVESNNEKRYLILPWAGGIEISDSNGKCTIINSKAPLALALLNKKVGEITELRLSSSKTTSMKVLALD